MKTTNRPATRTRVVTAALLLVALTACAAGEESVDQTMTDPTEGSTAPPGDNTGTGTDSTSPAGDEASDLDPCTVLTVEEINSVFPGNDAPVSAEGTGCLYQGLRIDLAPLTLESIQAEEEPTGWEVRPMKIDGAEWAVARVDTNVTEYEKVLDVIARGPNATVHLIADFGTDIEMGSPTYEGLVSLLQTAMNRT